MKNTGSSRPRYELLCAAYSTQQKKTILMFTKGIHSCVQIYGQKVNEPDILLCRYTIYGAYCAIFYYITLSKLNTHRTNDLYG